MSCEALTGVRVFILRISPDGQDLPEDDHGCYLWIHAAQDVRDEVIALLKLRPGWTAEKVDCAEPVVFGVYFVRIRVAA